MKAPRAEGDNMKQYTNLQKLNFWKDQLSEKELNSYLEKRIKFVEGKILEYKELCELQPNEYSGQNFDADLNKELIELAKRVSR